MEHRLVWDAPWQIFQPPKRWVGFKAASAHNQALTAGTGTPETAATGSLQSAGRSKVPPADGNNRRRVRGHPPETPSSRGWKDGSSVVEECNNAVGASLLPHTSRYGMMALAGAPPFNPLVETPSGVYVPDGTGYGDEMPTAYCMRPKAPHPSYAVVRSETSQQAKGKTKLLHLWLRA